MGLVCDRYSQLVQKSAKSNLATTCTTVRYISSVTRTSSGAMETLIEGVF